MYVYIYIGKSDKNISISGKVDKPNTYKFSSNISFFKAIISVWFIHFSTYLYPIYIYIYIYIYTYVCVCACVCERERERERRN